MDEQQPIIIKKKKGGDGHHGGAWKVAYADFVTAMMALFIVLWVLGSSEEVKEAVAGYFKDPVGFSSGGGKIIEKGSMQMMDDIDENILTERQYREMQRKKFEEMQESLMHELSENSNLSSLMDQVVIEMVEEGLRIEMLESDDEVFFQLGSWKLNEKAYQILLKIGEEVSKLPNKVAIEGHTDSRPYNGRGEEYTNYELSADRANSARRALIAGGLKEKQLDEVRGYADNRLRDKENPFSLLNRRISIIIKYQEGL